MAARISAAFTKLNIVHKVNGDSLHVVLDSPENLAAFAKLPPSQIKGKLVHEIVADLARAVVLETHATGSAKDNIFLDHNETHHIATIERHPAGFLVPVQRLHAVKLRLLHRHEVTHS